MTPERTIRIGEEEEPNGVLALVLEGRLDTMTSGELSAVIRAAVDGGRTRILLDCARVEYMSSAGLRAVVQAVKLAKARQGWVGVAAPGNTLRNVFEVSGVAGILPIFPSREDAIAAVSRR